MYKYKATVFDMDGTLVDSAPGVLRAFQYALDQLGLKTPENFDLRPCLGPPLSWSFNTLLKVPQEQVATAIDIYRQYYGRTGIFEAELYPGVRDLLEELDRSGATICLATTKYSLMAEKMLEHFDLRRLIRHAAMATAGQTRSAKKEMLEDLRERCGCGLEEMVMIGDTRYDAEGAAGAGVDFIGVTYGYGLREEMEEAGARKFISEAAALRKELLV